MDTKDTYTDEDRISLADEMKAALNRIVPANIAVVNILLVPMEGEPHPATCKCRGKSNATEAFSMFTNMERSDAVALVADYLNTRAEQQAEDERRAKFERSH